MRGRLRSSAKRVAPVTLATASILRSAFPMIECWTVGMLEGGVPSNLPTFPRLPLAIQRLSSGLGSFPSHPRPGQLHRLVDLEVAGTAAEVSGERVLDLVSRRVRIGGEQRFSGQQEGGGAVATLR